MDIESSILSKIVQDKDYGPLADASIGEKFFFTPKNRRVFEWVTRRVREDGQVPTVRMCREAFPEFPWVSVDEPWSFLIKRLQTNYSLTLFEDSLKEAVEYFDSIDDEESLVDHIKETISSALNQVNLDVTTTHDVNVRETGDDRLDRYDRIQSRDQDDLLGIPMGFKGVDELTQGFQKKQLITIVGLPASGKSTVLLLSALSGFKSGHRVLFIGFEMTNDEQTDRLDAIVASLDNTKLRGKKGSRLSQEEWHRLENAVEYLSGGEDLWFSNDTSNTMTLSGISAKIDKYKPDLVIVDGVYMMHDETSSRYDPGSPQAITNITRGFKRLAQAKDVPIVISTQALEWKTNKGKITTNSIGYASSFSQDSDVIIAAERIPDYPDYNRLKLLKSRNSALGQIACKWDWKTGHFEEAVDPENPDIQGDGGDDSNAVAREQNRGW